MNVPILCCCHGDIMQWAEPNMYFSDVGCMSDLVSFIAFRAESCVIFSYTFYQVSRQCEVPKA